MDHAHLETSFVAAILQGRIAAPDAVSDLLEHLGSACPACAAAITEARAGFESMASEDEHTTSVAQLLRKIRAMEPSPALPTPEQVRRLESLGVEQRLLKIRNTPDSWDDPRLGEAVFDLVRAALPNDPAVSLEWALTVAAITNCYSRPFPAHAALATAYQGNAHRALGDFDRARPLIQSALAKLNAGLIADPAITADIRSLAGSLYFDESAFPEAIEQLDRSALHYMHAQDPEGLVRASMKLGLVYALLGDFSAAINADRTALAALEQLPGHRLFAHARLNLILHLQESGQIQRARECLALDEESLEEELPPRRLGSLTWLRARLVADEGNHAAAATLYDHARASLAEHSDPIGYAHASLEQCLLYYRQGFMAEVIETAAAAVEIFRAAGHGQDMLGALLLIHQSAVARALTAERLQKTIAYLRRSGLPAQPDGGTTA